MSTPALTRSSVNAAPPYVLALFRVVTGLLFACHGAAGLFGLFGGAPGGSPAAGAWPGWWAALIQFVGGLLVLAGLGTRAAALICSGSMAYAYFTVHVDKALFPIQNGGELSVLFCWSFLLIAVLGGGAFTLTGLAARSRRTADAADGTATAAERPAASPAVALAEQGAE